MHERLLALVGRYKGPTTTWFDPSAPPESSETELTAEPMLGGKWLRVVYRGTAMGKPHEGEMILGYHADAKAFEMAWVDTFHTGSAIMFSTSDRSREDAVDVLGSYVAAGQPWGWRTVLRREGTSLVLEAFNVMPDGTEHRAIESRLSPR